MKSVLLIAGASVVLLLAWTAGAQAATTDIGTPQAPALGQNGPAVAPKPPTPPVEPGRPPVAGPQIPGARPSRSGTLAAEMLDRLIIAATTAPWALKDADAQKLVDKAFADRKVMLQSELARLSALEKFSRATRAGGEAGIAAAKQEFTTASEKAMHDAMTLGEDIRALSERLQVIKPAAPMLPKELEEMKGPTKETPKQF